MFISLRDMDEDKVLKWFALAAFTAAQQVDPTAVNRYESGGRGTELLVTIAGVQVPDAELRDLFERLEVRLEERASELALELYKQRVSDLASAVYDALEDAERNVRARLDLPTEDR